MHWSAPVSANSYSSMISHPSPRLQRNALQRCQQTMRNSSLLPQAPLHLLVHARGHCILHPAPNLGSHNPFQQHMSHP